MLRRLAGAAIVALTVLSAASSRADDAATSEAQRRFREGLTLADEGHHELARLKFRQAHAVLRAPAISFNLAMAEASLGDPVSALQHYQEFLDLSRSDPRITEAMRERAERAIQTLVSDVAQLEVLAPRQASVRIDGAPVNFPYRGPGAGYPVTFGHHDVLVTVGNTSRTVGVDCGKDDPCKVTVGLAQPEVSPGVPATRRTSLLVPATLVALGAASVTAGVLFAQASRSERNEATSMRQRFPGLCAPPELAECSQYDAARKASSTYAASSIAAYALGAALFSGAVVTLLVRPSTANVNPTPISVHGTVGPTQGSAHLDIVF